MFSFKIQRFFVLFLILPSILMAQPIQLNVQSNPKFTNVDRLGVNLGSWETWGARQLARLVLVNPGFEGDIDRVIVIVSESGGVAFYDDEGWGYSDNYWEGATYRVQSGQSEGATGTIARSYKVGDNGLPQYVAESSLPPLGNKDVIILEKMFPKKAPWWVLDASKDLVFYNTSEARPGSTGKQSVWMTPKSDRSAELHYFIDHIADRAGKLIKIEGPWKFSFWMRSPQGNGQMKVSFTRLNGGPDFFSQVFYPTSEWKEYTYDFNASDEGDPAIVMLRFRAESSTDTDIYIDDVWLGSADDPSPFFRQELVDILKQLKPSFLRDWQGQLSDSYENRVADLYKRKVFRHRNWQSVDRIFGYSIPEFLGLCEEVGANPWIIVPPTFSNEDSYKLGQFLALNANTSRFSQVIVEYGNENWNWLYRAGGMPYPDIHGVISDKAFQSIVAGANGKVNIRKVINGQFDYRTRTQEYINYSQESDTISLAPYFFNEMDAGLSEKEALRQLFTTLRERLREMREMGRAADKDLAIYEINMHTIRGSAPPEERNPIIAGGASGSAFARNMIDAMLLKANPIMIYSMTQFEFRLMDVPGTGKLWGIVRDLGETQRLRPTGLAMKMLNQVIAKNLHAVRPVDRYAAGRIARVAFKADNKWTAALVSRDSVPREVAITFPNDGGQLPTKKSWLQFASPTDTNEDAENVTIESGSVSASGRTVTVTIPAYGFVVLGER